MSERALRNTTTKTNIILAAVLPTKEEQSITIRDSSSIIEGYNPMNTDINNDNNNNSTTRQRRATTWIGAGTDDVKGYRAGLSKHKAALYSHVFENAGGADRICLRRPGQLLMLAMLVMPGVFALLGGVMYSWSFDRNGLVGLIIDLGDKGADRTSYSVWNVGLILAREEITENLIEAFTVYFCAVCCILFAVITPIAQHVAMVVVFVKEMTLKVRVGGLEGVLGGWKTTLKLTHSASQELKIWYFIVEVLSGWATMDVFIVSIVVCLLQIGMLSEFLIPATCDFLDRVVPYGFVDEKDSMCFFVEAEVGYGGERAASEAKRSEAKRGEASAERGERRAKRGEAKQKKTSKRANHRIDRNSNVWRLSKLRFEHGG